MIYPAGIVFKGSGFYNTDYKNSTASNKGAESTETETKAETATSARQVGHGRFHQRHGQQSSDSSSAKTELEV